MLKFDKRSYQPELLDKDDIPFVDIMQNMKELNTINTLLGGHAITLKGIKKLLQGRDKKQALHICEIGCGGGDNLQAIYHWCVKKNIAVKFTGIDIKETCIKFAATQYPELPAKWLASDYASVSFHENKPDIIFNSLFCHHFPEAKILHILHWMQMNSRIGFFINDLHRHWMAYYSIRWITAAFSRSYLVKNDAPLSVARGFKRKEWEKIFDLTGIHPFAIQWKWAFRHLITVKHER